MREAENVRVLFIDDSDIENSELTFEGNLLKASANEASVSADIIIYKNSVIKNRYGQAVRLSLLLNQNANQPDK